MSCASIVALAGNNHLKQDLGGDWQFRQSSSSQWHKATVPGDVHTDLMSNKMIEDPFVGVNEKHQQWIGEKDWEYRRTFTIDKKSLDFNNIELVLEGLDTYADVYLNDYPLLKCDNMFRTWNSDAKGYLRQGENTIRIYFHSVFKVDMPKYLSSPFRLQAWPNNDQNDHIWLSLYARKAGYHYGWDWGPRLITAGAWRDVYLNMWNGLKIESTHVKTVKIEGSPAKTAQMQTDVFIDSDSDKQATVSISLDGKTLAEKKTILHSGNNKTTLDFMLKSPRLWWSNGLGEQHLYSFEVKVISNDTESVQQIKSGIRTVEVKRDIDQHGQNFTVTLNNRNVFMKGANYIPIDNFVNRAPDKQYETIIKSAAEANMNMLRVWGGGIYEQDIFYELCDKYGILVWQDIMFACGMFPADATYLNSVASEVKDNVKRLRNHPSIALWCGNNENEISYYGWGWRERYNKQDQQTYEANLKTLFYDVIPSAITSQDDTRYYHPTSPTTGYNDIPFSQGDVHFWAVWKGAWVEEYLKEQNIGRFMSEYGFQSYPDISTIKRFASRSDMRPDSEVMLAHQRAKHDQTRDPHFGNNMMNKYLKQYYAIPDQFDDFVYLGQIMQAEAVKIGIEAHRRAKPYCMGTLYWQINDCWPAASWSSIDYYGKWKALHYYAQRAFTEVLISPYKKGDKIAFKLVSDRPTAFAAELIIKTMTTSGEVVYAKTLPMSAAADACNDILEVTSSELFGGKPLSELFVYCLVSEKGKVISSNSYFPVYSNKYSYDKVSPEVTYAEHNGKVSITLSSDKLIRGVHIYTDSADVEFSDNYFDLIPGIERSIEVSSDYPIAELKERLKIKSVNMIE